MLSEFEIGYTSGFIDGYLAGVEECKTNMEDGKSSKDRTLYELAFEFIFPKTARKYTLFLATSISTKFNELSEEEIQKIIENRK